MPTMPAPTMATRLARERGEIGLMARALTECGVPFHSKISGGDCAGGEAVVHSGHGEPHLLLHRRAYLRQPRAGGCRRRAALEGRQHERAAAAFPEGV